MNFNKKSLKLDSEIVIADLAKTIQYQIRRVLRKQGAVIGISGGIDSSVVAALCAKALGPARVLGIKMPETDSAGESATLADKLAETFGFRTVTENIAAGLEGLGCYQKRDEAIKSVFSDYDNKNDKVKIVIPTSILEKETFNIFQIVRENGPKGRESQRLPLDAYLQIVAASNYKQRLRMATLYYYAERYNYAVVGTGNKDEHYQGFFVKYGDGGTDLKPIANLYKMQVFQIAEALGVPADILERIPTTDTYSAECTQEEFFFGLDFYRMDMLWYAMENDVSPEKAAEVLDLTVEQVERGYANIDRKIKATEYLRMMPLEIENKY